MSTASNTQQTTSEVIEKVYICHNNHQLACRDGFCKECAVCYLCQKPLTPAEYFYDLRQAERDSDPAAGIIANPTFTHSSCELETARHLIVSESVTIPRRMFDLLNSCRLLIEPLEIGGMGKDESLSIKTQEADAARQSTYFISRSAIERNAEEHQEYLYTCLRRMETCCAVLSLAVSKSRRSTELNLDKKIAAQNLDARETRRKMESNPTPRTAAKTEKRQLSKQELALEKIQKLLGCSPQDALIVYSAKNTPLKQGGEANA